MDAISDLDKKRQNLINEMAEKGAAFWADCLKVGSAEYVIKRLSEPRKPNNINDKCDLDMQFTFAGAAQYNNQYTFEQIESFKLNLEEILRTKLKLADQDRFLPETVRVGVDYHMDTTLQEAMNAARIQGYSTMLSLPMKTNTSFDLERGYLRINNVGDISAIKMDASDFKGEIIYFYKTSQNSDLKTKSYVDDGLHSYTYRLEDVLDSIYKEENAPYGSFPIEYYSMDLCKTEDQLKKMGCFEKYKFLNPEETFIKKYAEVTKKEGADDKYYALECKDVYPNKELWRILNANEISEEKARSLIDESPDINKIIEDNLKYKQSFSKNGFGSKSYGLG
jgi:hypothetical protein